MLLFWRKLLFYVFLALYFVLTPYAILYALGYLISPNPSGEIINKTGLISVVTEPKGARILVNGRKFSSLSPAAVRDLLPGRYSVQLIKKGYETWKKEVPIEEGWATRLEPAVLLPSRPEEEALSKENFYLLLPFLSEFRVFAFKDNLLESLTGIDIFLKREFQAVQKTEGAAPLPVLDYYHKPGSSLVLFKTGSVQKPGWQAVQLGREKEIKDITGFVPAGADFLDWDARSPDWIYFLKDGSIGAFQWKKGQTAGNLAQDVLGMGIKNGRLYVLKKDFTLWSAGAKGENLREEISETEGLQKIIPFAQGEKWFRIEVLKRDFFQKDLILFYGAGGRLLTNWAPYRLADSGVEGWQYATRSEEEKVLFWTAHELSVLEFIRETEDNPRRQPALQLLYSAGRGIRQAFWAYDDTHVVFRDGDSVFLTEARPPEPFLVRPLERVSVQSPVFYHDLTKTLYFLNPVSGQIVRRKITD